MKPFVLLSLIGVLILSTDCNDDDDNQLISGPEIEWVSGGTTTTYTYSGGVISGYIFHRRFVVLDESGEVTINVEVKSQSGTKVTETFNVAAGEEYALKVKGNKDGSSIVSPGQSCLAVVFSSPNCAKTQEINASSYVVSTVVGDTYYCPNSFVFGAIEISMP